MSIHPCGQCTNICALCRVVNRYAKFCAPYQSKAFAYDTKFDMKTHTHSLVSSSRQAHTLCQHTHTQALCQHTCVDAMGLPLTSCSQGDDQLF
jgi:hypothetical protein